MHVHYHKSGTNRKESVWERKEEGTRLKRFITRLSVILASDWSIAIFSGFVFMYNDDSIIHFTVAHST